MKLLKAAYTQNIVAFSEEDCTFLTAVYVLNLKPLEIYKNAQLYIIYKKKNIFM